MTLAAEGLNPGATARVGEPLTLTLRLKAVGLGFEQLPELNLPKIDGADIYPDKATTQNRDAGDVVTGERERKFAIVPNRSGPLTIPSIGIGWWDVVHDRAETASVPDVTLDVAGSRRRNAGTVSESHRWPHPKRRRRSKRHPHRSRKSTSSNDVALWRVIALARCCVVAGDGRYCVRRVAPSSAAPPPSSAGHVRAMPDNVSVKARVPQRMSQQRLDGGGQRAGRLGQCAGCDGAQSRRRGSRARRRGQVAAIDGLQRVLYAGAPATNLGATLTAAFKDGPHLRDDRSKPAKSPSCPRCIRAGSSIALNKRRPAQELTREVSFL